MTLDLDRLADKAINRELPAREEVLAVLASAGGAGTTLPANA